MTLFWILAAALVAASLAALARPLLRGGRTLAGDATHASNVRILREQLAELDAELAAGALAADQHAAARAELERRVLEETRDADVALARRSGRGAALALAAVLPLAAVLLYLALGNRTALDPVLARAPSQATPQDVELLVERLAQRMREQPGDPDGWALLGRSYAAMGRFEPARDAYAQAVALSPDDPSLLADYADALAMTQDRGLLGEPERLVQRALQADPDHVKALALAGTAALQRGDAAAAVRHWERAKSVAPPDSPFAGALDEGLREARAAAAATPASQARSADAVGSGANRAPGTAPAPAEAAAAQAGAGLRVRVALADGLAGRARPQDTVFVFARPLEGPRMPLAVARLRVADLPAELTLDDSSAMSPQLRLSAFERVVVVARVSRSGGVDPQPGDLEGQSGAVAPRGAVALAIDRLRE